MIESVNVFDKSFILETTNSIPFEIKKQLDNALNFKLPSNFKKIKNILLSGMGGSGISADIISSYLKRKSDIPIIVNKNTILPSFCDHETLCIFLSYSGNTQEIVSLCHQAISQNSKILLITKGGELEKLSNNEKIFLLKIDSDIEMPRSASLLLFYSVLGILTDFEKFYIDKSELYNSIEYLISCQKEVNILEKNDNEIVHLASKLLNKKIFILGVSPYTESIALRWKNQFNENSKELVFCANFPEMTHNEIVPLYECNLDQYYFLILKDKEADLFTLTQIDNTINILNTKNITIFDDKNESLLSRIVKMIYIGDYLSIYLAFLKKIDPSPIQAINLLKEKMKEI